MRTTSNIVGARTIEHVRLDRFLEVFARRPDRFAQDARRLCVALDARGFDLEIANPDLWRRRSGSKNVAVENQFTCEVGDVRTMGPEEELRLARRIEFATIRLNRALEQHGIDVKIKDLVEGSTLRPGISRRKREWHALRMEMVERNLYLVLINVGQYRYTSAETSDLIQAAAATLIRAVDGFDWRRGVLFRTYAVHWLKQGFRNHLYNFNNTVHVPIYLQKSRKHVDAAIQRLGDLHASVEDLARETGLSRRVVASVRMTARRTTSLDAPFDGLEGTQTLADELSLRNDESPYNSVIDDVAIESALEEALGKLTARERYVVKMRFGIGYERGHVYSEVAKVLGVSLERVRQILLCALDKMRTSQLRRTLELLVT